jgi:hypothetical protein
MLSSTEMRDQGPSWQQETERAAQSDAVRRRSEAESTWRSQPTRSVGISMTLLADGGQLRSAVTRHWWLHVRGAKLASNQRYE